jgi:hypothetical protein
MSGTKTATRSKTEIMQGIFDKTLKKLGLAKVKADRGKEFRKTVITAFMTETDSSKGSATVLYNRARLNAIDSGTLKANVIGRSLVIVPAQAAGPKRDANGRFVKRS